MTPKTVCEYILAEASVSEVLDAMRDTAFSRYPVIDQSEHPHGVVFRAEVLDAEPEAQVTDLIKTVKIVTDDISAEALLSVFLTEHQHMALVYDQYGTWLGLVTMEDVLETILGQAIMDETDDIPNMRRFARKRWENRLKYQSGKPQSQASGDSGTTGK